jgi:hypothetical protein
MNISTKSPIADLKKLIEHLFDLQFPIFDHSKYHQDLPHALKELYEISQYISSSNCSYETITFFCNIDRLIPYKDLDLTQTQYIFLRENQNNWTCSASLGSNKVYFTDKVEPKNSRTLKPEISEFLTTFALNELAYNFKYYLGLTTTDINKLKPTFQNTQAIWTKKYYIYNQPCSFYLADQVGLVSEGGMSLFSTNNSEKFAFYKNKLDHYEF